MDGSLSCGRAAEKSRRGMIVVLSPPSGIFRVSMRGRTFRIALLVFQALWLNVIMPGHRRGIVALPGEACHAQTAGAVEATHCCSSSGTDKRPDAPTKNSGDPALHCSLCYFAARVTPPPVVDLTPPPLRLLDQTDPPAAEHRISIATLSTYDGRAPPRRA